MSLSQHFSEALRNLMHSKLRSLLALLGVLVGTASVVAMISAGELATHEALKQFKSLGTDLLAVSISTSGMNQSLDLSLANAISMAESDKHILQLAPYTQMYNPVYYQGTLLNGAVVGITDEFNKILKLSLQEGRFISLVDNYANYCVVGSEIYKLLKSVSYKDPIGQPIQIGKNIFTIVGVANPWLQNNFISTDINYSIMVPIKTSMSSSKYAVISNMLVQLAPDADIDAVVSHIKNTFSSLSTSFQLSFRSAKEMIEKMKSQSDILTVFLALIGSISLFVGAIGVMNIMLVSVIERRREIGIRRAVGARRIDIIILFLAESVTLSILGGVAGVVCGSLIAFLIAYLSDWEFTLLIWPACMGFIVSVLVGIISGLYPAWQASRLTPIDALRLE